MIANVLTGFSILFLLAACASKPLTDGRIADLEPDPITTANPAVTFNIDRQQVIENYRALEAIAPADSDISRGQQRLADLELEASMDDRIADDQTVAARGRLQSALAIQRYQQYLINYPNRPDNDRILYQLSRAHAINEDPQKAQQVMQRIIDEYPDSKYMDEIQFRQGEHYFVIGNYRQSELAYSMIVDRFKDSQFFQKALYKQGWARFKQNRIDSGLGSFMSLLDQYHAHRQIENDRIADNLGRADRELVEDVLRVVSLSFSYSERKQPIASSLQTLGRKPYEPLLYQNLTQLFLDKDRITDAADTLLAFGEHNKVSPLRPIFHNRVIEIYRDADYNNQVLQQKLAFIKSFNIGSDYWSLQTLQTRDQLTPILTSHLYDIATHYHALARQSKKTSDYQQAAGWYQLYLDKFSQDSRASSIHFLLAESRYDARQFSLAVSAYEFTAYQYPKHDKSAEAGYAALIAYKELIKKSKKDQRQSLNNRLIESSIKFTETFPNDKRRPQVLLTTSEQLYGLKRLNEAELIAARLTVIPQYPRNIKHRAWVIIAHSQFELEKYAAAENSYQQVIKGLQPADRKQRQQMREQLATAVYRQGETARDNGQTLQAARHFERLQQVVPTSPKRIVAQYDAATEYIKLESWAKTIATLEEFRRQYPKEKKWRQGVSEKLALAYLKSNQKGRAAEEMLVLMKMTPKNEQRDMLWQAAQLYEEDGQQQKALNIYKNYVRQYPRPVERAIELRHKLAESYRKTSNTKNYHYWLKEIIKADKSAGKERSNRSRYLAAKATLVLIEPTHRSFTQAKLTIPLKKSLGKKKNLMTKSIKGYTEAAKYQIEEVTTAATFNIAEIYREFAQSLLNSEKPKGLDEDELEEYTYLLEDQAFPFEEKAIQIHEKNIARIPQGSFDESIQSSLTSLAKILPFRYDKHEVAETYVE